MKVESTPGTSVPMLVLCLICACGAQAETMLNVAHRGLWKEANLPQNTVEAIAAAYAAGAAVVETDFVETRSGEMICLHDRNALATMSTVVKDPAEITAADRAVINLGEKAGLPRPYRIPLLSDVLAVVPKDRMIQAEIKVYGPTYARQFDAAVRAAGLCETNVLVSSFDHGALKDFRGKYPKYRTLWLGCGITGKGFDLDKAIARVKDGGFDIVCPGCGDARKAGFARADADRIRAAGFDFRVYGVNDENLLDYAAGLGASGFTCNYFKAAYAWARRRGGVTLLPVRGKGIDRALLREFLSVPSESGNVPEINRSIDVLRTWLEARGVFCSVVTNEVGRGWLYAATTPERQVDYLFVGHVDVVPAPREMFTPRTEGDRIFARGACDTKGNDVVMCQVLANLVGKASVGMFLASEEEGGGPGARSPVMAIERGHVPRRLVLVGDSAGEEPGQLFTAEKGHAHVDLIAHGKGGHSSRPWALDNPIPKLCEGYLKFRAAWDSDADPNEHWRTVLSPTILRASEVGNVVPDEATMHFSCRYTTMAEYERVVRTLKETTGLEVRAKPGRRPVENRPDDPEIAALLKAMAERLPGGIREGRMSAATDASYYVTTGVPIVIFACEGGEPHSDREWGSLKSLDDYADFYTEYFARR